MKNSIKITFALTILLTAGIQFFSIAQNTNTWKEEARARINKHRKVNLKINVVDTQNNPINDATIEIKLVRHHFKFGAVVDKDFLDSKYTDSYKKTLKTYFNSSGFENALKPKRRFSDTENKAEKVMQWLKTNDFSVRGHALVWENPRNMRNDEKKVYFNKNTTKATKEKKLFKLCGRHFKHAIPKWDVICWDVLNEPIGNHHINDLTTTNTFAYWFKLADKIRKQHNKPNLKLFINENRVISGTTPDTYKRPKLYRDIIQGIIDQGAPIEGIGMQSRIKHSFVSPEDMYNKLKSFEGFNLPIHATEFEVRDTNKKTYTEEERKQIIEQFMLIYVSHPLVEGIWHWTFFDNKKGRKPWALFNYDGTPTVSGEQWLQTMKTDFNTHEKLTSDSNGNVDLRAFKGDYKITITHNNSTISKDVTFTEDTLISLTL